MKKRFSDEQNISILREAEVGVSAREVYLSGSVGTISCESLTADLDTMLRAANEMLYNCKRPRHHGLIKPPINPRCEQVRRQGKSECYRNR